MNKLSKVFHLKIDNHQVAHISVPNALSNARATQAKLERTISECRSNNSRAIFLNIADSCSKLVPIASKLGFTFHRVNIDNSLEMIIKFNEKPIPSQFTHTIGGSALVLSPDLQRIFLVQEKTPVMVDYWHPPGGKVENNEFLLDGIAREVYEETKIKGEVFGPIYWTESYPSIWKGTNMYFLGIMIASSENYEIDPVEIVDGKWFSLEEYTKFDRDSNFYRSHIKVVQKIIDAKCKTKEDLEKIIPFNNFVIENEQTRKNCVMFHLPKIIN